MHTRKPTPVLIVKGNGTGNYCVPKVDKKRLKTDMVPYVLGVGSSIYYPDIVPVYIRVVLAMSSPYIDQWNGVKDIGLMLKEISTLKRL